MTKYRDSFSDSELGSIVGCGLDRLDRDVTEEEILRAINFFNHYKKAIYTFPIGARRQSVEEFVSNEFVIPSWIIKSSDAIIKETETFSS